MAYYFFLVVENHYKIFSRETLRMAKTRKYSMRARKKYSEAKIIKRMLDIFEDRRLGKSENRARE